MTLGIQMCLLVSWHEYVELCYEVYGYATQWYANWLEVYIITLGISTLLQRYDQQKINILAIA